MPPTLHIVVNCADRKLFTVHPTRRLRTVHDSDLRRRARVWWGRLTKVTSETLPAVELYGGSYWAAVRRLPQTAEMVGFRPQLWIISAGYGLLNGTDRVNSYSATFSAPSPDSVTPGSGEARTELLQRWWGELTKFSLPEGKHPRSFYELIQSNRGDRYLVVASPDYLTAVAADLSRGAGSLRDPDRLVVISSRLPSSAGDLARHNVPSDARLQCFGDCRPPCRHLVSRGVRGVIGPGVALAVLNRVSEWGFGAAVIRERLGELIDEAPALHRHDRRRMGDDEVGAFVKSELAADASASCAVLLRRLRDSGRACEQARFKQIYWQTKRSLHEA